MFLISNNNVGPTGQWAPQKKEKSSHLPLSLAPRSRKRALKHTILEISHLWQHEWPDKALKNLEHLWNERSKNDHNMGRVVIYIYIYLYIERSRFIQHHICWEVTLDIFSHSVGKTWILATEWISPNRTPPPITSNTKSEGVLRVVGEERQDFSCRIQKFLRNKHGNIDQRSSFHLSAAALLWFIITDYPPMHRSIGANL